MLCPSVYRLGQCNGAGMSDSLAGRQTEYPLNPSGDFCALMGRHRITYACYCKPRTVLCPTVSYCRAKLLIFKLCSFCKRGQ